MDRNGSGNEGNKQVGGQRKEKLELLHKRNIDEDQITLFETEDQITVQKKRIRCPCVEHDNLEPTVTT